MAAFFLIIPVKKLKQRVQDRDAIYNPSRTPFPAVRPFPSPLSAAPDRENRLPKEEEHLYLAALHHLHPVGTHLLLELGPHDTIAYRNAMECIPYSPLAMSALQNARQCTVEEYLQPHVIRHAEHGVEAVLYEAFPLSRFRFSARPSKQGRYGISVRLNIAEELSPLPDERLFLPDRHRHQIVSTYKCKKIIRWKHLLN